jgi:probable rRNA maturation factor
MLEDDRRMAGLNADHLGCTGPTDVLSFPMGELDPEREAFFLGEIVVGFEIAEREARERGLTVENELARYAVHGFLHLLGFEDGTPERAREMEALQEEILRRHFGGV